MEKNLKNLFDSAGFVKMYKLAEKFTGFYALELIKRSSFKQDLTKLDKLVVLDNACGTGVVSSHLMSMVDNSNVSKLDLTCADYADAMINATQQRIDSTPWPNAKVFKADAQDTKLPSSHFTHIFFSFGPMLIPSPSASMKECLRMLVPNGVVGINTWEAVGWYADVRDGLAKNPKMPSMPTEESVVLVLAKGKERWEKPKFVLENLEAYGFKEVEVYSVPNRTSMDVQSLIDMLPQMMGLVFTMLFSEEQRKDEDLKKEAAESVASFLREKYGDKPVEWDWVAICGLGRKPE